MTETTADKYKIAPRIVLASSSPRREQLLKALGLKFEIIASEIEEEILHSLPPETLVVDLARQKADSVFKRLWEEGNIHEDLLILAADTLVVIDGAYLGKPSDEKEARQMLSRLSGRWHEVYTGVSLISYRSAGGGAKRYTSCERSRVLFRALDNREIAAYVETGEPMDKAGAYALQGIGSALVQSIEGSHTNIVGLPIPNVVLLLRQTGYRFLGIP